MFWFDILPDDIIAHLVSEWIGSYKVLQALDIALCNRNFRQFRYEKCLTDLSNIEICIKDSQTALDKLHAWQKVRRVIWKRLTVQSSDPQFLTLLADFPQLRRLDIHLPGDSQRSIDISEVLSSFPLLQCVSMGVTVKKPRFVENLPKLLPPKLSISDSNVTSIAMTNLSFPGDTTPLEWLQSACPKLQDFRLFYCDIIDSCQLLPTLRAFPHLHSLTYVNQYVGPMNETGRWFYARRQAGRNPNINQNEVIDKILTWDVTVGNADNLPQITSLTVENKNLIVETAHVLSRCPQLKNLTISLANIESDSHTTLFTAKLIPTWTSLQRLTVTSDTPVPARILEEIAIVCKQLTFLSLNFKTKQGTPTLTAAMQSLRRYAKHLTHLELHTIANLSDADINALCQADDLLPKLNTLVIRECKALSNRAYQSIMKAYGPQLMSLSFVIENCYATWCHILRSAAQLKQLHTLEFTFSGTTPLDWINESIDAMTVPIVFPTVTTLNIHMLRCSMNAFVRLVRCFPALLQLNVENAVIVEDVTALEGDNTVLEYAFTGKVAIQTFLETKNLQPYGRQKVVRVGLLHNDSDDDE